MDFFNRKFLFEADEEEGQDPNVTNPPEDMEGQDPNVEGDNTDENQNSNDTAENQDTESNEEDNQDDGSGEEDFTIDDADMGEDEASDEEGGEDPNSNSEDTSGEDSSTDEEQPVDPDSLKAKDAELFDSLSPDEQKMKLKVMKKMFLDLYTNAELIINKINNISSEIEEVDSQLKRTLKILFELKKMIYDYIMNSFDNKSYIENDIMYTRYLSIFNSVKNITTEIRKACVDDSEEVK